MKCHEKENLTVGGKAKMSTPATVAESKCVFALIAKMKPTRKKTLRS